MKSMTLLGQVPVLVLVPVQGLAARRQSDHDPGLLDEWEGEQVVVLARVPACQHNHSTPLAAQDLTNDSGNDTAH